MQTTLIKKQWLLPAVLILFILEIVTLPLVIYFTYSDRAAVPSYTLSQNDSIPVWNPADTSRVDLIYTENSLSWYGNADVDTHGAVCFHIFDALPRDEDGIAQIYPGATGHNTINLANNVAGPIDFTAVLYVIRSDERLPLQTSFSASGTKETEDYTLPKGSENAEVIGAFSGTLGGGRTQRFDIGWSWDFSTGAEEDALDTLLSTESSNKLYSVGLYVVVEDGENYIPAAVTGATIVRDSYIGISLGLLLLCLVILLLIWLERRREKKWKQLRESD